MDPNLEKIKSVFMNDIRRGWYSRAVAQARDYLFNITNGDEKQVASELNDYVGHLKSTYQDEKLKRKQQRAS
jgi:hypothetical protein